MNEDISPPKKSFPWLAVAVVGLLVVLVLPPAVIVGSHVFTPPTLTLASPLAEEPTQTFVQKPTTIYSPSDYISLSERYFADAQTLSQKRQQTDEDKKDILEKLQKAINTISEGINLYPNRSELWVQRASIYTTIQSIAPQAGKAAINDLEQAQRLSQHSPSSPSHPSLPSGLELIKDQQTMTRDVIVAAPDEATSPYEDAKESSAITGTAVIPASQTSLTVENIHVTDAAPIYVVPKSQTSTTLSVVSKIAGFGFTVALDSAQSVDIPFQYWVTK